MKKIVAVICAFLTLFAICSCESVLTPNDLATSFGRLTAANVGTITYVTEVKKDGVVTSLIPQCLREATAASLLRKRS